MLTISELYKGLAAKKLCLKLEHMIAGEDTDFYFLSGVVRDAHAKIILVFDYSMDTEVTGGNINPKNNKKNPHGWFLEIETVEELLSYRDE